MSPFPFLLRRLSYFSKMWGDCQVFLVMVGIFFLFVFLVLFILFLVLFFVVRMPFVFVGMTMVLITVSVPVMVIVFIDYIMRGIYDVIFFILVVGIVSGVGKGTS